MSNAEILTALIWVLIRVVSAVVLTVTLPGQGLTERVIALELIHRAASFH